MTHQNSLEYELLDYFYNEILSKLDPWLKIPFKEIIKLKPFNKNHPNDVMYAINQSVEKEYIEKAWIPTREDYILSVKLVGILKQEKNITGMSHIFTDLMVKILKVFRDVEIGTIQLVPGVGNQWGTLTINKMFNKLRISNEDYERIRFIIYEMSGKFIRPSACGYSSKDGIIFFKEFEPILKKSGRDFLLYHTKLKNLFNKIQDLNSKEFLKEDYDTLYFLMKHKKWREVAIKMGSILDLLTYQFFLQNGLKIPNNNNPDFHERIIHIQKNQLIGDPNDWFRADQILRHYRNFIHPHLMLQKNLIVDQKTIKILEPIFQKLISLF